MIIFQYNTYFLLLTIKHKNTTLISYEINRWCGLHDNWLSAALSAPGKWLQHLTTNEPDDSMIECAIRALELVIPDEKGSDEWGK